MNKENTKNTLIKLINKKVEEQTCWVSAGTSWHNTPEQKLEILRYYTNE